MSIKRVDTSDYNGNEVLNDAARRGDLEAVQGLIVDETDYNRWKAVDQAWNAGHGEVIGALLEAGVGEQGRNALLERFVGGGLLAWTEHVLREGTSEQARGFALNGLADWRQDLGERSAKLADRHHSCLHAVLAAGVAAEDRRHAREKAQANGDDLLSTWLAE